MPIVFDVHSRVPQNGYNSGCQAAQRETRTLQRKQFGMGQATMLHVFTSETFFDVPEATQIGLRSIHETDWQKHIV